MDPRILQCLDACGVLIDPDFGSRLEIYRSLLSEWNSRANLMATGDLGRFSEHVADSLSLARYIQLDNDGARSHLDVGSGGGFPGIPLACLDPGTPRILLERSERKAAFLSKCLTSLSLESCRVICVGLSEFHSAEGVWAITARAIERPGRVYPELLTRLGSNDVLLAQWEGIRGLLANNRGYTCVEIDDCWTEQGLRRGRLYRVVPATKFHVEPSDAGGLR